MARKVPPPPPPAHASPRLAACLMALHRTACRISSVLSSSHRTASRLASPPHPASPSHRLTAHLILRPPRPPPGRGVGQRGGEGGHGGEDGGDGAEDGRHGAGAVPAQLSASSRLASPHVPPHRASRLTSSHHRTPHLTPSPLAPPLTPPPCRPHPSRLRPAPAQDTEAKLAAAAAARSESEASAAKEAGLDKGLPSFSLPHSRLYGESLYVKHINVMNDSVPSYIHRPPAPSWSSSAS